MDFLRTAAPLPVHPRPFVRAEEPAWDEADDATWREIAHSLVEGDRLGEFRGEDWSLTDVEVYGAYAHGFTPEQTAEVLRIGKKLLELPEVDRAFDEGWLSWRQVVLLTRVAVPRHESAWLDRALEVPLEEFEALVERSAEGWTPPVARHPSGEAGGAAVESVAEALVASSWRRRAHVGDGRVAGGPGPGARALREPSRGRLGAYPWRHRAAPNVRRAVRDAFSSA